MKVVAADHPVCYMIAPLATDPYTSSPQINIRRLGVQDYGKSFYADITLNPSVLFHRWPLPLTQLSPSARLISNHTHVVLNNVTYLSTSVFQTAIDTVVDNGNSLLYMDLLTNFFNFEVGIFQVDTALSRPLYSLAPTSSVWSQYERVEICTSTRQIRWILQSSLCGDISDNPDIITDLNEYLICSLSLYSETRTRNCTESDWNPTLQTNGMIITDSSCKVIIDPYSDTGHYSTAMTGFIFVCLVFSIMTFLKKYTTFNSFTNTILYLICHLIIQAIAFGATQTDAITHRVFFWNRSQTAVNLWQALLHGWLQGPLPITAFTYSAIIRTLYPEAKWKLKLEQQQDSPSSSPFILDRDAFPIDYDGRAERRLALPLSLLCLVQPLMILFPWDSYYFSMGLITWGVITYFWWCEATSIFYAVTSSNTTRLHRILCFIYLLYHLVAVIFSTILFTNNLLFQGLVFSMRIPTHIATVLTPLLPCLVIWIALYTTQELWLPYYYLHSIS